MKKVLLFFVMALCIAGMLATALADEEIAVEPIEVRSEETVVVDDGREGDMAERYINSVLYPKKVTGLLRAVRPASSYLQGTDLKLYRILRGYIGQVAEGQLPSTVFTIALGDLYPQLTFTADELGIESVFYLGENEAGQPTYFFSEEAVEALNEKVSDYSLADVIRALLADCPYELYWYDKTEGTSLVTPYDYDGGVDASGEYASISGALTISMCVSPEYDLGPYRVNPAYGQGAQAAALTAQGIVAEYEGLAEYDRLDAYRERICALASYNDYAARNDPPYGNPWQLVWVFDGDPSTTVVCEGYAKAFKYLNDLSGGSASVILATGLMDDEAHMWNIVTMDDGLNYIADITNCDEDMVGYPKQLFLTGCKEGSVEDGYIFRAGDGDIHYSFKDEDGYNDNAYSVEELTMSSVGYLDNQVPAPAYTASATRGYVGYRLVVRLDEPAGSVRVRETGEEIACDGRDVFIDLTEAGEFHITIATVSDGRVSAYGEELVVQVAELGEGVVTLPADTLTVEAEAFRGISAAVVQIPDAVETIEADAFADIATLQVLEISDPAIAQAAFSGYDGLLLCLSDADAGFDAGVEFLVK